MNTGGKVGAMLLSIICPEALRETITTRVSRTKRSMTGTKQLRIFWSIVLFPIVLPFSLFWALLKTLLIWITPIKQYGYISYVFNLFYEDIAKRHYKISFALRRAKLSYDLLNKGEERRTSYGEENKDKIFYVIRPYYYLEPNELIFSNVANLLTQYYYVVQKLSYAIENNWIPIIDWKSYGTMPHCEDYPVNETDNPWEYYWKQPSEYSLEEVYKSKHVILSTQNIGQYGFVPDCAMKPPFAEYAEKIVDKCPKYIKKIPFNDIVECYIGKAFNGLFRGKRKILGVVIRGAAYGRQKTPYGSHPMQADMEETIKAVRKYMKEWSMEYVFFVNEMQELVDIMRNEFNEKLIVFDRMRDHLDRPTDGITKNPLYLPGNKYQTNLDYVTEIALLSKCDALIGSMSSGMRAALMWNDGNYENYYIFEKGLW